MSKQKNVSTRKLETVKHLKNQLENHYTVGIVQMEGIGAGTVQKLRADLRERARIVVAKNTLMKKALETSKVNGAGQLITHVSGPAAFLFTNNSPYQIANYLEKNKVKSPAKSGQISPISVTIPKMNTGFPPGIVISELNSVGLPTRIEGGTVAIQEDTQVLEPGDKISSTLATIMSKLGIEPFQVGLSLDVILENGEVIMHDDLIIDYEGFRNQLLLAFQSAINLSVYTGFITIDTAPMIIVTANQKAISLAVAIGYITETTAPMVIGMAEANAIAVLRAIVEKDKDAVPGELAKLIN